MLLTSCRVYSSTWLHLLKILEYFSDKTHRILEISSSGHLLGGFFFFFYWKLSLHIDDLHCSYTTVLSSVQHGGDTRLWSRSLIWLKILNCPNFYLTTCSSYTINIRRILPSTPDTHQFFLQCLESATCLVHRCRSKKMKVLTHSDVL